MHSLNILLLGSGGREHALAWRLARSQSLGRLVCAPGNPGMASLAEVRPVDVENPAMVVALARELAVDLVVVGAEAPLAAGVADALAEAGIAVFGPKRGAARLEWDKAFAKDFMVRNGIPTAASRTFGAGNRAAAQGWIAEGRLPVVIKASGLAAGKGVVIAETEQEAVAAIEDMLSGAAFGEAGSRVVVEEFMAGEEASIFAITDGEAYVVLAPSQDHKRIGDGDTGPNTGGMGAYAPAPIVTPEIMQRVRTEIIEPTLAGMAAAGTPYAGCLYVGVMIDDGRPRVVEFNSRFGDPETQVVLPLLDGDFADLLYRAATGTLGALEAPSSHGCAVCVVMAASGYPGAYAKGAAIEGVDAAGGDEHIVVFQAGTRSDGDGLVTNGGRVLGVTAIAGDDDLASAIEAAYRAVGAIHFDGAVWRSDIGSKGIARMERSL